MYRVSIESSIYFCSNASRPASTIGKTREVISQSSQKATKLPAMPMIKRSSV